MSLPVSVCILVHQKNKLLHRVLAQLDFASQIVIVDNTSEQQWSQTEEKRLDIIPAPGPVDNFSTLRNLGASYCREEWTLFLDSDEVLEPFDQQELRAFLAQDLSGGLCLRTDYFLQQNMRHGEVGSVWLLRLVKTSEVSFSGAVHEVAHVSGAIKKSPLRIQHFAHPSISSFLEKISRYVMLAGVQPGADRNLVLKLLFFPLGKFLYTFIIKSGWRDGWRGLSYSVMMSIHSIGVRSIAYENQQ